MTEQPFLPTRAPRRNHETAAFWDACAVGRLVLPRCDGCRDFFWYPRLVCPFCSSHSVTYVEVSGRGPVRVVFDPAGAAAEDGRRDAVPRFTPDG